MKLLVGIIGTFIFAVWDIGSNNGTVIRLVMRTLNQTLRTLGLT